MKKITFVHRCVDLPLLSLVFGGNVTPTRSRIALHSIQSYPAVNHTKATSSPPRQSAHPTGRTVRVRCPAGASGAWRAGTCWPADSWGSNAMLRRSSRRVARCLSVSAPASCSTRKHISLTFDSLRSQTKEMRCSRERMDWAVSCRRV